MPAVGHSMLEKPSPNWNARQVTCLLTPRKSPIGARIGIDTEAAPVEEGMKKLIIDVREGASLGLQERKEVLQAGRQRSK